MFPATLKHATLSKFSEIVTHCYIELICTMIVSFMGIFVSAIYHSSTDFRLKTFKTKKLVADKDI